MNLATTLRAGLFVLLLFSLPLAGCARKTGVPGAPDAAQAQALWAAFASEPGEKPAAFSMSASLNIQSPQRSARLLVKFWGNLELPLRLDLATGMGQSFSMWREDSLGWLAVYPLSNQAFTHPDTRAGLSRLGMPFPFTLKELASISSGRFGLILPSGYKNVKRTSKGYEYSLPASSAVGSVTLDFEGKPIHLTGRGVEPWIVELGDFAAPEAGRPPLAHRLTLTTPGGLQVIMRTRKIELFAAPMDLSTLELPLPPQARHIPLNRGGDVRAPELP
ncbi:MAG: hypothetical protein ACLGSA_08125 [Acidobacteriota bacterium]